MTVQTPKIKSLQTAFFNARSLRTTRNELEVFADSHDLDVILVNETFLRADDPDPKIRGFTLHRTDRTNGAGGGTAIFVRRTLPHYPNTLPALQNLEATAVTIETANGPLTLISCYHRPQDRLRENDITNILDTGASVIAAGDFNSKHLTWGSRETNRNGRILFDLADATDFLIEAPPEPTYYDSLSYRADILDIALIKNVPFQIRLHVSLALNSDHMPVLMHIGDEANDANTNITIRTTNWSRFAEILETNFGPIPRIESVEDLESAAGALEDKIKSAMTDSTRTRVEPRQKEILPQWIVDLIRAKIVPGALPFGLATLSTEQRQIGLATKSNTRSSIIALIGGKPNSNLSRRRTTRSGEWRKRSVQTTSHFPPFRVQTDSSSRTWTKRRRSRTAWNCNADQTSSTPTRSTSRRSRTKFVSFFRDMTTIPSLQLRLRRSEK
jgi:hypothetical protein